MNAPRKIITYGNTPLDPEAEARRIEAKQEAEMDRHVMDVMKARYLAEFDTAPEPEPEAPLLPAPDAPREPAADPMEAGEREEIISGFIDILKTGRAAVEDTFRQMDADDRVKLFPLLNAELSRLNNQEALLGRSIPRKAEVESLIGILAKVGEA